MHIANYVIKILKYNSSVYTEKIERGTCLRIAEILTEVFDIPTFYSMFNDMYTISKEYEHVLRTICKSQGLKSRIELT
jgi:hypothetical protein